jgi:hypothetical protein
MKPAIKLSFVCCIAVGGCASPQLNYNALDITGNIDDLITAQVVGNLGRFVDEGSSNPSQATFGSGTVSTTNTASLGANNPLNNAITSVASATFAPAALIPTVAGSTTALAAATSLSPAINNQASQNYALSFSTQSDVERRLRALYQFATYEARKALNPNEPNRDPSAELCREYAIPLTSDPETKSKKVNENISMTNPALDGLSLREPTCVVCSTQLNNGSINVYKENKRAKCGKDFYINPRLSSNWLKTDDAQNRTYIGSYAGSNGFYKLYTDDKEDFRQFVLFVAQASTGAAQAAGGSTKGPGQSQLLESAQPQFLLR